MFENFDADLRWLRMRDFVISNRRPTEPPTWVVNNKVKTREELIEIIERERRLQGVAPVLGTFVAPMHSTT